MQTAANNTIAFNTSVGRLDLKIMAKCKNIVTLGTLTKLSVLRRRYVKTAEDS